ncbi:MAG: SAF domain-containing protein [Flavobacteriaceae bacterium]|jgi:predicted homoserine dehydrogenase-like protein
MVIVDSQLNKREKNNNPIKVAVIGAGEMGKGIINQITKYTPGITVAITYNRTIEKAIDVYKEVGISNYKIVDNGVDLNKALDKSYSVITSNIDAVCDAKDIDVLLEVTGTIEFAAQTILKAFKNGINVLSFNVEIDATLGPLLKQKAKEAGVKYSVADGDQPGVTMNLYRYVKSMGFEPLLCGNIKGLQDHYRNPTTQKGFAAMWDMTPEMVTSFADGTKISFEQACIANATGMQVAKRGMYGYHSKEHVDDLTHLFDIEELKSKGGIVDYIVGAKPGPGVFIYATTEDPIAKKYLKYGKLGEGPLYSFYIPYHLLFFEIASAICRLVDFDDTIITAEHGMMVDVVAVAKESMKAGDIIDGLGGYKTYGVCENYNISRIEMLLPMGLAEGCKVIRDIAKDQVITYADVELPANRLSIHLRKEQDQIIH